MGGFASVLIDNFVCCEFGPCLTKPDLRRFIHSSYSHSGLEANIAPYGERAFLSQWNRGRCFDF